MRNRSKEYYCKSMPSAYSNIIYTECMTIALCTVLRFVLERFRIYNIPKKVCSRYTV